MPCIIHWNFNHFVVLEGIDGSRAYINDPAMGRRRIDMAELDLAFTGVVLTLRADRRAFRKIGSKPRGLRLLLRELRGSRDCGRTAGRRQPCARHSRHHHAGEFSKIFIDEVLIQNNGAGCVPLLIGMGITALFRMIVTAAAAVAPAAAADQARGGHDQPLSVARDVAADGLLCPAPRRRHRQPGQPPTSRSRACFPAAIVTNALSLTSVVFFAAAMAIYDIPAGRHRRRHVADQRRWPEDHLAAPGGPEPQPRARAAASCWAAP